MTETEKTFCVLEFHFTKCVTTAEGYFAGHSIKIAHVGIQFESWVNRHFTEVSTATLLVSIAGVA
jgi:hypothetical protein